MINLVKCLDFIIDSYGNKVMINNIKLDENKLYINVKLQAFLNLIFFKNSDLTNLYLHGELLPINATIMQKHEPLLEV